MRRLVVVLVLFVVAAPAPASASQLLDRNAAAIRLAVNRSGQALVSYSAHGRTWHVLVWGAVDARDPNPAVPQVRFRIDRSGGWGTYRRTIWKTFANACTPYSGPALPFLVTACTAPDGTHWALQTWQTPLPDLGFAPWTPRQSAWELHVSHWTGDLAQLEVYGDWVYSGRFQQLFGRLTYRNAPVYGFKSTRYGASLDAYGRLVFLDTFDSVYGKGWRRENSFLAHNPTGVWCYGFFQFDPTKGGYAHPSGWPAGALRGPGTGTKYRLTVIGPGVTPDVSVIVPGLHPYDADNPDDVAYERQQNGVLDTLTASDKSCGRH